DQKWIHGHEGDVTCLGISPDRKYFASSSQDQTIRIWPSEKPYALLSLFVAGNEWVLWSTKGYYACSPGGERFMGWSITEDPNELTNFHPARQFTKTFHRPEMFKKVLEAGSVSEAFKLVPTKSPGAVSTKELTDYLPPRVNLGVPIRNLTAPQLKVSAN